MSTQDDELMAAAIGVLELFAAVCGAPDDPETARQADAALWRLDDMLADAGSR
jgi:hypothetical protein